MEEKIVIVLNEMSEYLSITQMKKLQEVIIKTFAENKVSKVAIKNEDFLNMKSMKSETFAGFAFIFFGGFFE